MTESHSVVEIPRYHEAGNEIAIFEASFDRHVPVILTDKCLDSLIKVCLSLVHFD